MVNVKKSALRIDFGNVEKISFYIPIYDNTQFILQSPHISRWTGMNDADVISDIIRYKAKQYRYFSAITVSYCLYL